MTENDFPQPGALLSLVQAKQERRCRICGEPIPRIPGQPMGWTEWFREMTYPLRLTLNFGKEFAHTECLK